MDGAAGFEVVTVLEDTGFAVAGFDATGFDVAGFDLVEFGMATFDANGFEGDAGPRPVLGFAPGDPTVFFAEGEAFTFGFAADETLAELRSFGPFTATAFGNAVFVDAIFGNAVFVDAVFVDAIFVDAIFGNAVFVDAIFVDAVFGNAVFGNAGVFFADVATLCLSSERFGVPTDSCDTSTSSSPLAWMAIKRRRTIPPKWRSPVNRTLTSVRYHL